MKKQIINLRNVLKKKAKTKAKKTIRKEFLNSKSRYFVINNILIDTNRKKSIKTIFLNEVAKNTRHLLINNFKLSSIVVFVSYENENIPSSKFSLNFKTPTTDLKKILKALVRKYELSTNKHSNINKISFILTTTTNQDRKKQSFSYEEIKKALALNKINILGGNYAK